MKRSSINAFDHDRSFRVGDYTDAKFSGKEEIDDDSDNQIVMCPQWEWSTGRLGEPGSILGRQSGRESTHLDSRIGQRNEVSLQFP
jgi:hypothetical protein